MLAPSAPRWNSERCALSLTRQGLVSIFVAEPDLFIDDLWQLTERFVWDTEDSLV